jgi:hypothetical protein
MKTKKLFLILIVITTTSSVPAFAKDAPSLPEDLPRALIGRPHPELGEIEELYVVIKLFDAEPSKNELIEKELDKLVRDRLKNAGITIAEVDLDKINPDIKKVLQRRLKEKDVRNLEWRAANIPELRVDIEMITLDDLQRHIFRVQTSLARTVALPAQPNLHFHAVVWKKVSQMQTVSIPSMPAEVTKVVLDQVDTFITAFAAANPPGQKTTDANDISAVLPVVTTRQTTPVTKPATAEYRYVASKNSKVFHKPDCPWAKRIKPENLVTFSTREKAIEAGKRPCKQCKP